MDKTRLRSRRKNIWPWLQLGLSKIFDSDSRFVDWIMPVVFVENIHFNIDMCKFESSQSEDSRAQPVGFTKAYSNPKVSNCRCQITTFLSPARVKINFLDYQINMNSEKGNVWNQSLVSSVLVSLYAVTKVPSQIWGPRFARGTPGGDMGFLPPSLAINNLQDNNKTSESKTYFKSIATAQFAFNGCKINTSSV